MNIGFTAKAQNALNMALKIASELGHTCIGSEHILLGLLSESEGIAAKVLNERGADYDKIKKIVEDMSGVGEVTRLTAADMTPRTKKIIEYSAKAAMSMGHGFVGTEHLLFAIADEPDCYAVKTLSACGVSASDVKRDIIAHFGKSSEGGDSGASPSTKQKSDVKGCPSLSSFGRDLCANAKAGKIDPIIGRDEETERVIRILSRRTKNNPCLIGEPGVGKTAVVEGCFPAPGRG